MPRPCASLGLRLISASHAPEDAAAVDSATVPTMQWPSTSAEPRPRPDHQLWEMLLFPFYATARTVRLLLLSIFFLPQLLLDGRLAPVVLRRYLQTCSGGFIKLGQILAMRYDLLPEEYCHELAKLLDQMPPVPLARIERIIAEDLGRPVAACFQALDAVPLGSASIAQVHAARLPSGEAVAVKVVRPGIARTLRVDMAYLGVAGRFSRRFGMRVFAPLQEAGAEEHPLITDVPPHQGAIS